MTDSDLKEVLMRLLHGIRQGDIEVYKELVSPALTCFEPETKGHNVDGLPFHFFFMEHAEGQSPYHIELVDPRIRVQGDMGYTAYTMLIQKKEEHGFNITRVNETRIFSRIDGNWKMIHFHRS